MKTHHPKLKTTTPRPSFSCGFFRHCTQTVLSPTTSNPPTLPLTTHSEPDHPHPPPPPPLTPTPPPSSAPPPHLPPQPESSESSSSSNTSQSFTQWRFSLPHSPISHPPPDPDPTRKVDRPPPVININFEELFHAAELQLSTGSEMERVKALYMLERAVVPNPPASIDGGVAAGVMRGVVDHLKERAGAKPATKVLLALCLAEGNRQAAVEAGAAGKVVEALADMEGPAAERALAALELLCTVAEGAAEVRAHALAVPMMVQVMGRLGGRGREYAISVLAVVYGGLGDGLTAAPAEEVARAVVLALQGDSTARGRRKGAQLLKILQDNVRLELTHEG
ncbi:hypothetical protein RJ639_024696 [Escallonia herrerae]|uniref:U-box domain-containing protein n=1 Tax=Escallonia herrerae TaxID=1293975 RepID=A0AA88V0V1_9ASTE|nr:hypothetical protein RJ639_024696 [Escallonia herrerae]